MINGVRPGRPRTISAALLAAGLLSLCVPGIAAAACARSASTSAAFAQFGDAASYVLAPGGSFENGTPGWSLSNASVVAGNESYNLVQGTHSLQIGANGSAVSPWVCISSEYPSFRFVVRQLTGTPTSGHLNVSLRWINLLGITINSPAGAIPNGFNWSPTPALQLGSSVPLWLPGTSLNVALVFSAQGTGTWAIDDVYIDPYSR
jgi:hypothetical protein